MCIKLSFGIQPGSYQQFSWQSEKQGWNFMNLLYVKFNPIKFDHLKYYFRFYKFS